MATKRISPPRDVDVLILGDHPSSYLAATLAVKAKLSAVHATLPDVEPPDRLVMLSPPLGKLNSFCGGMVDAVTAWPIFGVRFLADDVNIKAEHTAKIPMGQVARFADVRAAAIAKATAAGLNLIADKFEQIETIDETGLTVLIGKSRVHARVLLLAGILPRQQRAMLGLPDAWPVEVMHRFTTLHCKSARQFAGTKPLLMPMSLDLRGELGWAWLLPGEGEFQLSVEQPVSMAHDGPTLLAHWVKVLQSHGVLPVNFTFKPEETDRFDLPLAGALAHEGVANRTLLIGPAGGFYTACGEDIYPGCWSAVFAIDVLKTAMRASHVQDALNPFRQVWRTTLGAYMQGPHENLKYLLPLVYRNPAMTARLAEAILLSKSVVR